ncbi:MAG: 5'-nucleotidase, lipoprotein e(P4) family [Alphaproteobacteria bacterium]|jgi:acid phosphatase|nr:5'-nucleotidase, lipoprotein e(P4) family [Alphaproteobacteria bacterium]MDP6563514.1 5'-nucleotidase, lipoprotein e(P4) family [Alphaproteobacteria bacterium]
MKSLFPKCLIGALALSALAAAPALAKGPMAATQNDNLNATLWLQTSVEFKAHALAAYRLGRLMLDQALADKSWTALPGEQGADYAGKPPAVILDVDETVLDNSLYQAWTVTAGTHYSSKTWGPFVNDVLSRPVPGSLDFIKYAASKGVKVFYVSNRKAPLEEGTRKNLAKFGYPVASDEDTVLLRGEKPEWKTSKKSPRRSHVAAKYRVVLLFGDNFGDFVDGYKGSLAERQALFEKHDAMWGSKWIMLANPSYGSWESAAFGHDWRKPGEQRRQMKHDAFQSWQPK